MLIADMPALQKCLADAQRRREGRIVCELTPALSARVTDAEIAEALVTGLPMARGLDQRIVRSRGRGVMISVKVRYRDGVRMLDHHRTGMPMLTADERTALEMACAVAGETAALEDEEMRFQCVFGWICRQVRYVNTAPGQKGYERLVGAAGALMDGQANCQGFADLLYLLCGLCGVEADYRCGRGERQLHAWNEVWLKGAWRMADASKAARGDRA